MSSTTDLARSSRRLSQHLDSISDPEVKQHIQAASQYLRSDSGTELFVSAVDYDAILADLNRGTSAVTNLDLASLNASGFQALQNDVRAGTAAMQGEIRAVGNLVAACHADNIEKLNRLQQSIEAVNNNVVMLGGNVSQVAGALLTLQNDFASYVESDVMAKNVQQAETKLVGLKQELDSEFGHNKELRRTAVGMLEASDMAAVRTDTILTRSEELCIQTPGYWLAPALVTLAHWISASTGNTADSKEARQALANTLNEAYRRDREKTSLFFGLICRRANFISEANEWFREYISFQRPEKVDQTCMVLLNAYAAGVMGHGDEEREILETMSGWLDYLIADADGRHERRLIDDWRGTCAELVAKAQPSNMVYQALPQFASEIWPQMRQSMQATYLHRELDAFLRRELARRDFDENDLTLIDDMISNLVSSYDGKELPIRRDQQYQQLVIDLGGNKRLAGRLRSIKDGILSETKSFLDILSDAARDSSLSSASAATHVYAIKTQMKWIRKAYDEEVAAYRAGTPQTIPFQVGDFEGSTQAGENEEETVQAFVQHVNRQERNALEKAKTGPLHMAALIGGAVLALVGIVMGGAGFLLALVGIVAAVWGFGAARKAKAQQQKISAQAKQKRESGVLVIRKLMQEVRDWRGEYASHEQQGGALEALMAESIVSDGATLSAFAESSN